MLKILVIFLFLVLMSCAESTYKKINMRICLDNNWFEDYSADNYYCSNSKELETVD